MTSGIDSIWSYVGGLWQHFLDQSAPWDIVGYLGTAVFGSRFILQWYVSERLKRSVIPNAFWWLSLLGTLVLAIYFVGKGNGPGVVGSVPNAVIYIRNLQLIRKQRLAEQVKDEGNT